MTAPLPAPPANHIHSLVVSPRPGRDPRASGLLNDAHALGLRRLSGIECHDLYFIAGALTPAERERLSRELLCDPLTQSAAWRAPVSRAPVTRNRAAPVIEVALHPGVTDPVAEQLVRAAHMLGLAGVERAATGQRYVLQGGLSPAERHTLARRLLANPVIQQYALGEITPSFPAAAAASGQVETIALRELEPAELLALSRARRAALDLDEMRAIQDYYRAAGRDPSDVEFETLAQTWSEHCVHKTFRARLDVQGPPGETIPGGAPPAPAEIDGLLKHYLRVATERIAAPWVRSAFVDNAGILDFDDDYEVSFKVETHNHPSAIEPFGGANTGVGGVIRDILGVSAKPIAATDVLCFGPLDAAPRALPEGVLHPRRVQSGVVAGIQDYGNKIGLPTVNGAILYDPGYTANPLVFCGCVGLAPKGRHPRDPQPGDRVILLGGRTGRDGLRGATFSSMTMDGQTGEVAGASVQIGDPITEKGLLEVITRARDLGLYHAINDCGAGGLASAVGELADPAGAEVDLQAVRLKYPGLAPWEIWLSEAQERMVLAVPPNRLEALRTLCATFDVELTDIGAFTRTGRLVVRRDAAGAPVLDLANAFLHGGRPQRRLLALLPTIPPPGSPAVQRLSLLLSQAEPLLLRLLAHPDIASKAAVIRVYDHEVLGGTIIKPLTGAADDGPSDAAVLRPIGTRGSRGIVLSNGINPQIGKADPYRMALSVVDEAIRNAVASGADPDHIALLDNFCWGDPNRPTTLGALVEAARGCHDAALHYAAPFVSGKDSLNNEYLGTDGTLVRHAIPPTLLISALGLIEDVGRAVSMDFKEAGNCVYLLGETRAEFGGSHLALVAGAQAMLLAGSPAPGLPAEAPALYRALHRAMQAGLVRACHDLSEGGLAVSAAEMCLAGRLGAALTVATADPLSALFSESNGRFLAEVRPANQSAFETLMAGLPARRIGLVTGGARLSIGTHDQVLLSLSVTDLLQAWQGASQPTFAASPASGPEAHAS